MPDGGPVPKEQCPACCADHSCAVDCFSVDMGHFCRTCGWTWGSAQVQLA
ncbi:MAG: hypothetical protein JRN29_05110 [Nitrososphaerota archaeon]|nr:hypothetical protein [Nitrososphaerota archaeon]